MYTRFETVAWKNPMSEDEHSEQTMPLRYRWNQLDPYSAGFFKLIVFVTCTSLMKFYFLPSHPKMAFVNGSCIGVLLAHAIPPRLSTRKLVETLLGIVVLEIFFISIHWL